MATFSKRLFESLANLSDMSQYLVVINNVQGITEQEADTLKELAFALDSRFVAAHQSFIIDRNTNALVANWRKLLAESKNESKHPERKVEIPKLVKRTTTQILSAALPIPGSPQPAEEPGRVTGNELIVLRDKVGLGNLDPRSLVAKARGSLKGKQSLTFEEFSKFMIGVESSSSDFNQIKKQQALKILFDNIDEEKSGSVDRIQALNKLIVMCGGTSDSKSEATFMLYDLNGDGLLSFDELLEHQTCVFRILNRVNPGKITKTGETPESLARATVESIFLEADNNGDGVITLQEFQAWIKGEEISQEAKEEKKVHVDGSKNRKNAIMEQFKQAKKNLTSESANKNIQDLKKTTGLGDVHVEDALRFFKSRCPTGHLTRKHFAEILKELIAQYTEYHPEASVFNSSVNQLYVNFDRDGNGVVDSNELFCGLSMLCAGNCGDKLKAACDAYDESSDGKVQFLEVIKYFQSVFSVLLGPEAKRLISPIALATVTTKDLFKQYELDETGEIGFEQLKDWFDKSRVII